MTKATSLEKRINQLKKNMGKDITIHSLFDYMELIFATQKLYLQLYYRGQSNQSWEIVSSAYRKLACSHQPGDSIAEELYEYHDNLMQSVRNLRDATISTYDNMDLLAYLQHHMANTNLIDFTQNPLIALWFACQPHYDKDEAQYTDGAIFWVAKDVMPVSKEFDLDKLFFAEGLDGFHIHRIFPPYFDRRIIAQESVFLVTGSGQIETHNRQKIIVPETKKEEILEQLRQLCISQKTLFPDVQGLGEWFQHTAWSKLTTRLEEAAILNAQGQKKLALERHLKAAESAMKVMEPNDIRLASIWSEIGGEYHDMGDVELGFTYRKKSFEIRNAYFGNNHPETASSYNALAVSYRGKDDYKTASEYYSKALAIYRRVYGNAHPKVAVMYNNLAYFYYAKGNYHTSKKYYDECLLIRKELYRDMPQHRSIAAVQSNLAAVLLALGKTEEALKMVNEALTTRKKIYGDEHSNTAFTYVQCGKIERVRLHYDTALDFFRCAMRIRNHAYGEQSATVAVCLLEIGVTYSAQVTKDNLTHSINAEQNLQKALEIYNEKYGSNSSSTAHIYYHIAELNFNRGDYTKAEFDCVKAHEIFERVFGTTSSHTKEARALLAAIRRQQN